MPALTGARANANTGTDRFVVWAARPFRHECGLYALAENQEFGILKRLCTLRPICTKSPGSGQKPHVLQSRVAGLSTLLRLQRNPYFRPCHPRASYKTMPYPSDDRIRELSAQALAAKTQEDVRRIGAELRLALGEHMLLARESLEDQAGIIALLERLSRRAGYAAFPVTCGRCGAKQAVHILGRTGDAQVSMQTVVCAKCKGEFSVLVPDRIIAGPFIL